MYPSLPKSAGSSLQTELVQEFNSFRECSANSIVEFGVCPDQILLGELAQAGFDRRCGVNIMARPPLEILQHVSSLQAQLQARQPRQYYYPLADLHLTVLELSFDTDWATAVELGKQILPEINGLITLLSRPIMQAWGICADRHGAALNFLPIDGRLSELREVLRQHLTNLGFKPNSRYQAKLGHLTIMRYLEVIAEPALWTEQILATAVDTTLSWEIGELYLTWGADWYGMRSRNQEHGPFVLRP